MLSTRPIGASESGGAARYYDELARDDYYTKGGEPRGVWVGRFAQEMGLSGLVEQGQIKAAFAGFNPVTGEAMAANAGGRHHGGYDFTFSAPKSVSIVWASADEEMRKAISEAQAQAVAAAIAKVEEDGSFRTLHGHAGKEKHAHTGGLAVATFEHSMSREGDPQLHTHALVFNLHRDGRRIDFDTRNKIQIGAAYRVELAARLEKLGFETELDKSSFRIRGVPKSLEAEFSKRRAQIVQSLHEKGLSGGKAAAVAALATREKKGEVDREKLFNESRLAVSEAGFSIKQCRRNKEQVQELKSFEELASGLVKQNSTVTRQQLEAYFMQAHQGVCSLREARERLESFKASGELIELRDSRGETRYTSVEMYAVETQLVAQAEALAVSKKHQVGKSAMNAAVDEKANQAVRFVLESGEADGTKLTDSDRAFIESLRGKTQVERDALWRGSDDNKRRLLSATRGLSVEQRAAFDKLVGGGDLVVLEGSAGTGKSFMLDACRVAWEREGYDVLGCALAAKAAKGLQESANIKSSTLHSLLAKIDNGKVVLNSKSVIVVDEAGMVGSQLMAKLQSSVSAAGGKLVVVGDTMQVQAVDAGGAMRAQRSALERAGIEIAEMIDIRRQRSTGDREMVLAAKEGRAADVIERLRSTDGIVVHETKDELLAAVGKQVLDVMRENARPGAKEKSFIAMFDTNAETRKVNEIVRRQAQKEGLIGERDHEFVTTRGVRQFATGDKIYFLRNDNELGVLNSQRGTVVSAEAGRIDVKTDDGRLVSFDHDQYRDVDHAYAATIHKSQGDTVDGAAYALGTMANRHAIYVAASRHRDNFRLHVTKDQEEQIKRLIDKSEQKDVSVDYERVAAFQGELDTLKAKLAAEKDPVERQIISLRVDEVMAKQDAALAAAAARDNRKPTGTVEKAHAKTIDLAQQMADARTKVDNLKAQIAREIQFEKERNHDYSNARRAAAALFERRDSGVAKRQAAQPIGDMRDVSGIELVHHKNIERGRAQGVLQVDVGNRVDEGKRRDHAMRSERNHADGAREGRDLASLNKQLTEAVRDLERLRLQATKAERALSDAAAERQKQREAKLRDEQRIAASLRKDGDLAKRALESHRKGLTVDFDRMKKEVKKGRFKTVFDSAGKLYAVREKDGAVFAASLNKRERRSFESANINHGLLTKTKYVIVDKRFLSLKLGPFRVFSGFKYGSTVLKSGGTLRSEFAGVARGALRGW